MDGERHTSGLTWRGSERSGR